MVSLIVFGLEVLWSLLGTLFDLLAGGVSMADVPTSKSCVVRSEQLTNLAAGRLVFYAVCCSW